MNILEEIAERTRVRIAEEEAAKPLAQLRKEAEALREKEPAESVNLPLKPLQEEAGESSAKNSAEAGGRPGRYRFYRALQKEGMSYICEVKKASPSKGLIAKEFPYVKIAKEYELAGAAAVSCLTEPYYFKGSDDYLREIAETVSIPVLRKDFTVNSYMVYQAKLLGAAAILLICAILDDEQIVISTNQGEPLSGRNSQAEEEYRNICKRLMGEDIPYTGLKQKKGVFRMIGSLFHK